MAEDCRAWVRIPSDGEACCQPLTTADAEEAKTGWLGRIRDASPGGIALLLKQRFELGTVLSVEIATRPEGRPHHLVRVVHATPAKKGDWLIGCAFANPLSQEELQNFLQNP
jgi:PilZ domain